MINNISKKTIIFLLIIMFSLAGNIFLFLKMNSSENSISGEYFRFIKPLEKQPIDSNVQNSNLIIQYNDLKETLEQEIKRYDPTTEDVGIFLQDIQTGAWLGINEKEGFSPASLLKIPIMMVILKKVDREEISLKDDIVLTKEDIDPRWGELYKNGVGTKVSVLQLMEYMVDSSDNTAKNALKRQLSINEIDSVFVHVGIPNPYFLSNNQTVSPRNYIRFFKTLYYSTFLSPHLSELALDLTTDSKEEDLISKDIPPEVQIAHKFGIFEETGNLHDCGIIYHQKNPYFLCIMTKNLDITKSRELIPKLSKDIFDFVNKK